MQVQQTDFIVFQKHTMQIKLYLASSRTKGFLN
jgi:hypothetical protein